MLGNNERHEPHPTYMSEQQKGNYLHDLRKTRPERPTGSRPAPPSRFASIKAAALSKIPTAPIVETKRHSLHESTSLPTMKAQTSHRREGSTSVARNPFAGRPIVQQPSYNTAEPYRTGTPDPSEATSVRHVPSVTYTERGSRWMEKQEAQSIRQAMDEMRLKEGEERRLHAAARDEAAELVYKHQHPDAAADAVRVNPDLKRDYRSHLRKGSYRRSVSSEGMAALMAGRSASRSSGEESEGRKWREERNSASFDTTREAKRVSFSSTAAPRRRVSPPNAAVTVPKTRTPAGPSYGGLAEAVKDDIARAHRRSSSGSRRILSGEKKLYMHPDDKIWEDPQEDGTPRRMRHEDASSRVSQAAIVPPPIAMFTPATAPTVSQPSYVRKNPFARVRMQAEKLERTQSDSAVPSTTTSSHHRVEIQKNPPSQSRNGWYMSNVALPPPTQSMDAPNPEEQSPTKESSFPDGREIRGDDIRAATSKSRKDYSPKLPRPTLVSDKPGRPIVSFDKPRELVPQEMKASVIECEPTKRTTPSSSPSRPSSLRNVPHPSFDAPSFPAGDRSRSATPRLSSQNQSTAQPIPTISLPDSNSANLPVICIQDEPTHSNRSSTSTPALPRISVDESTHSNGSSTSTPSIPRISVDEPPAISINGPESSSPSRSTQRQPPPPSSTSSTRPLPHHAATFPLSPQKSTPHYTATSRPSGILCSHCALPIAGRILSADGHRFHPSCFNCYTCNTNLEHVAFYPEPTTHQSERLSSSPDQDPTPRFYCHLDFHEHFSPRCKSCKTPIEGEIVVACGANWHVGHFFCAQCGDPFDSTMPFVEKEGYAWCVPCHANRSAPKCRGCRKPVLEMVLKALGAEWHSGCFVCGECKCEFADGKFFLRPGADDAQTPFCVRCEERRLKA